MTAVAHERRVQVLRLPAEKRGKAHLVSKRMLGMMCTYSNSLREPTREAQMFLLEFRGLISSLLGKYGVKVTSKVHICEPQQIATCPAVLKQQKQLVSIVVMHGDTKETSDERLILSFDHFLVLSVRKSTREPILFKINRPIKGKSPFTFAEEAAYALMRLKSDRL